VETINDDYDTDELSYEEDVLMTLSNYGNPRDQGSPPEGTVYLSEDKCHVVFMPKGATQGHCICSNIGTKCLHEAHGKMTNSGCFPAGDYFALQPTCHNTVGVDGNAEMLVMPKALSKIAKACADMLAQDLAQLKHQSPEVMHSFSPEVAKGGQVTFDLSSPMSS
jgi:hypothetical protein